MTEVFGLFDAADPGAPDRVYTSEAFARLFRTIMRDGVVHNGGDELVVSPTVPAAMSVDVGTGMALVQGRYLINDADLTLTVEAADPSYARIDRVIVRADLVGRTVHAVVKQGTPAASPVAPGLTRTTEVWELSLAQIAVAAGATSLVAGNITDERGNSSLCGVAAPVYVPSSQLEVVGAVDMQGQTLTGLPAPSAAGDAARKGYVDTEIAEAVGGFGISQIAIDADKDWGGNDITNVGGISVQQIETPTYDLIGDRYGPICYADYVSGPPTKNAKAVPNDCSGSVNVHYVYGGNSVGDTQTWLVLNDEEIVGTRKTTPGNTPTVEYTYDDHIEVEPGDVIGIREYTPSYTGTVKVFEIRARRIPKCAGSTLW